MAEKIEKSTQMILGIFAILLLIIYTIASFGIKYDFTKYVVIIVGIVLALTLLSEASVYHYFRSKGYKKITGSDFLVFASILLAGGIILNSLMMISQISLVSPAWLLSFAHTSGAIIGLIGIVVAVIFIITPRIKA